VKRIVALCLAALGVLLAAPAGPAWSAPSKQLTVFAAASLKEFMDDAVPAFEKAHPGVKVRANIASSSELRIQIQQGAPADVFLSADNRNMDPLVTAKLVQKPETFTKNTLIIMVARRYRNAIKDPTALAAEGRTLVLAAPEVPVGNYSRQVLAKMEASGKYGKDFSKRVLANVRSDEPSTKAVVAKVLLGEAEAGMCYLTDATPDVRRTVGVVTIPEELNITATYPIAVVTRSRNKPLAQEFVDFILSKQGKDLLRKHGFAP
jgi:molybdate transport system substrate-binding protein